MRRTTIFRSSLSFLVLAFAASLWTEPVEAQADTAAQGRTHVVSEGETLWGIAEMYFGDPFLWPQIFRLNTSVVEDPHWIFPGEVLDLDEMQRRLEEAQTEMQDEDVAEEEAAARDPGVEAPGEAPPPPPPPSQSTPTVFTPRDEATEVGNRLPDPFGRRTPVVTAQQFHAAGFLTEGDRIAFGDVVGAVGKEEIERVPLSASVRLFDEMDLEAPGSGAYRVGDSLLVVQMARKVEGWGEMVRPRGIAVVTTAAGRRARARLVKQFGVVADGQRALPLEPFDGPGTVEPTPVEDGMTGSIIQIRDLHLLPNLQHYLFVNRGRVDGVRVGDEFEVLSPDATMPEAPSERVGVFRIVHVRQRSATGMLIQVYSTGIEEGAPVRLIRKMPS